MSDEMTYDELVDGICRRIKKAVSADLDFGNLIRGFTIPITTAEVAKAIAEEAYELGKTESGAIPDNVTAPIHYQGDGNIEAMDAMRSMTSNAELPAIQAYWWGCAFKYLWRWPHKNGIEDLRKCRQCLDYLIAEVDE